MIQDLDFASLPRSFVRVLEEKTFLYILNSITDNSFNLNNQKPLSLSLACWMKMAGKRMKLSIFLSFMDPMTSILAWLHAILCRLIPCDLSIFCRSSFHTTEWNGGEGAGWPAGSWTNLHFPKKNIFCHHLKFDRKNWRLRWDEKLNSSERLSMGTWTFAFLSNRPTTSWPN